MRYLYLPLLAAFALAGCAGGQGRQAVAVVNGSVISAADVAAMLPENLDSARADTLKRKVLEGLITRKLFAQEAVREGMEKDAEYQVELEQKALVNKRLYDVITAPGNRLTEMELQNAYKLLQTEAHLRLISVPDESLAKRLSTELDRGAVFESLAVKYSRSPSAVKGGDVGFRPYLYIDEPLRTRVMVLKPGQHTQPTPLDNAWQIAMLVETRPGNPPPLAEYRQEMEYRLKMQRRREMAGQYLADVRRRITYNPAGLDILTKPLDSITAEDKEVAVAYKDQARYVKVARLLSVAQRFTPGLDTAMKKYAVRRAIEEDLIYEDALNRGLAKAPDIVAKLGDTREEVLYKALYKREVTDKVVVTDADVMDYFRANRQNFTSPDSSQVAGMIRSRLLAERRDARLQEYLAGLKAKAKITVNDAALRAVHKPPRVPDKSKR
jgi:hypothetical protein